MNKQQAAILRSTMYPERVTINAHGQAVCPYCRKAGEYKQDGQASSDDHKFVWDNDVLVAVDR